jgi:thiamine-phosphate pyrophosphorylase
VTVPTRSVVPHPLVMMVTDRRRTGLDGLLRDVRGAARAGVDLIQLRERGLEDSDLLALAGRVTHAAAGGGSRTVINDRFDIALAAGADGVHLPGRAVVCGRVRAAVPEAFLIGRSVHSLEDARAAEGDGGCDYLVFGAVFATASKPLGHAVAGLDALARVCASVRLPVVAIGGITLARMPDVVQAGASGIAAIGLFAGADERELIERVRRIRMAYAA